MEDDSHWTLHAPCLLAHCQKLLIPLMSPMTVLGSVGRRSEGWRRDTPGRRAHVNVPCVPSVPCSTAAYARSSYYPTLD